MSMIQETPMDTLRRVGITPGGWARDPGRTYLRNGIPCWEINSRWLSPSAMRELAHLIAEGWAISTQAAAGRTLTIRITAKGTP